MIRQVAHPMLRGLRFFAVADNVSSIKPLSNYGGGPGAVSGNATLGRLADFPSIKGDKVDNLVTFDSFSQYFGSVSRDITVICRCVSNSSHIGGVVSSRSGGTAGWQILMSNFSGSETGYNFAVFSSGGKFMEAQDGVGAVGQIAKNVVIAGKYVHSLRECYIYARQPGEPIATIRNSHTNTNSSNTATEDWDIRAGANPLYFLNLTGLSVPFDGDVAWLAVFDRELSNGEIADWSRDEEWPFTFEEALASQAVSAVTYAAPELAHVPVGFWHPVAWQRARPQQPKIVTPSGTPTPAAQVGQVYAPELDFSPVAGPWHRRPKDPSQRSNAASVPVPIVPQLYAPPLSYSPATGPWNRHVVVPASNNPAIPSPPPPPPIPDTYSYAPPFHGGPLPGPWRVGPFVPPEPVPTPPLIPPPPPPSSRTATPQLQRLRRPLAASAANLTAGQQQTSTNPDKRLRAHTDLQADITNALFRSGQLVQVNPSTKDYTIGARFVEARAPGFADDATSGAVPGCIWIDTTGQNGYLCISASVASAIWKLLT